MEGAQMSHDGGGSGSHSGGHSSHSSGHWGSPPSSPHHDGSDNSGITWYSSYPRRQRAAARYRSFLIAGRIVLLIAVLLILRAILHV
jgi:hypothetical protein